MACRCRDTARGRNADVAAEARPAGVGHRRGGGRWLVRGQDWRTTKRGARQRRNTTRVDEATITRRRNDNNVTFDVRDCWAHIRIKKCFVRGKLSGSHICLFRHCLHHQHNISAVPCSNEPSQLGGGVNNFEENHVELDMFNSSFA